MSLAAILMDRGNRSSDEFAIGRQNNVLYDTVDAEVGPGTASVNTYTMHVTCGTSHNEHGTAHQNGNSSWEYPELPFITEIGA
jgi:hypothetical protein